MKNGTLTLEAIQAGGDSERSIMSQTLHLKLVQLHIRATAWRISNESTP